MGSSHITACNDLGRSRQLPHPHNSQLLGSSAGITIGNRQVSCQPPRVDNLAIEPELQAWILLVTPPRPLWKVSVHTTSCLECWMLLATSLCGEFPLPSSPAMSPLPEAPNTHQHLKQKSSPLPLIGHLCSAVHTAESKSQAEVITAEACPCSAPCPALLSWLHHSS
jgi:hypothetical protein